MEVILFGVLVVALTALAAAITLETNSPTLPAAALSLVVVPIISDVEVKSILVAEAAPNTGVTSVGDVLKTVATVPVEDVTPVPPLATGKVPVTPVVIGRPVQLVNTPEAGVPRAGVTRVGEVLKTVLPVPVEVVTPVPPLATGRVPVTPVVSGNPVAFVNTPEAGVPNAGVTSVGDVYP